MMKITKDTSISIGVLLGLGIIIVGAWSWTIADAKWKVSEEGKSAIRGETIQRLETDIAKLIDQNREAGRDRWYRTEMIQFATELRERNKDLVVPTVRPLPDFP